jgi:hypothetical protein
MRGFIYRTIMKIAHKYNWHYAPPVYPDGDKMLWCQWCGFRAVVLRRDMKEVKSEQGCVYIVPKDSL